MSLPDAGFDVSPPPSGRLTGYWSFDTSFIDDSGSGNDFSGMGGFDVGKFGNAAVNSALGALTSPLNNIQATSEWSWSAWVYVNSEPMVFRLWSMGVKELELTIDPADIKVTLYDGALGALSTSTPVVGDWFNCIVVMRAVATDLFALEIWVNGAFYATVSVPSNTVIFGGSESVTTELGIGNGKVDDMAVIQRALTQSEITSIASATGTFIQTIPTGPPPP